MTALTTLALSVGVLAVAATWLVLGMLPTFNVQIWQVFIAWACFFHSGGKTDGLKKTVICMVFGALDAMLAVMLIGQLGALGTLAVPVAVGIGAAVIVLAAHVGLLATIPASVYGFASVAGLVLLKGLAPVDAIFPTIASIVIGALFGWVSEWLAGKMTKA